MTTLIVIALLATLALLVRTQVQLARIRGLLAGQEQRRALGGSPYRSLPIIAADAPALDAKPRLCFECKHFRFQLSALKRNPECTAHPRNAGGFRTDLDTLNRNRDCRSYEPASNGQMAYRREP